MTREIRSVCPAAFPEGYTMEKKPKLSVLEGPDGVAVWRSEITPHVKTLGSVSCGHPLCGAEDAEKGLMKLTSLIPFSFSFASRSMGLREVSLLLWVPCTGGTCGTESSERLQHRHAGQTETVVWLFTHLTLELQRNQKIRKCSLPQAGPRRHIPARLGIESCRPVSAQLFTHPSSRVSKGSPLPSATSPTSSNTFHLHPTTQPHCLALTLEYAN